MRSTILFALVLGLVACSSQPEYVARLDDHHTLGAPTTVRNLTVWPVFTDQPLDVGEFLTLPEALERGQALVRECGEGDRSSTSRENAAQALGGAIDAPTVGTLVIENKSKLPILVCAGTVVKGGKQDRQIGQDFVVQASATVPVDAFCVEHGRWTMSRGGKSTAGRFEVAEVNAVIGVRTSGQYLGDQGKVWENVKHVCDGFAVEGTTSFAVATDENDEARTSLAEYVAAVRKHLDENKECVGFAYAINGKPINVRTFAHPRIFRRQLEPFVNTMATEALLLATSEQTSKAAADDIVALVRHAAEADETVKATAGLNRNGVKETPLVFASACRVPASNGWIPVTRDWTAR